MSGTTPVPITSCEPKQTASPAVRPSRPALHLQIQHTDNPDLSEYRHPFNCLICLEQFTEPFFLDCRHVFCDECVRLYNDIFRQRSIKFFTGDADEQPLPDVLLICPICRRPTSSASNKTTTDAAQKTAASGSNPDIRKISRVSCDLAPKCDACIMPNGGVLTAPVSAFADVIAVTHHNDATGFNVVGKNGFVNAPHEPQTVTVDSTPPPRTADCLFKAATQQQQQQQQQPHQSSIIRGMSQHAATLVVEDADFQCAKCELNLCKTCRSRHDGHPLFRGHTVVHISSHDEIQLYCYEHGSAGRRRACTFYCEDCNQAQCVVCVLQDEPKHRTAKLRDVLANMRDTLKTLLNRLGPPVDRLGAAFGRVNQTNREQRIPTTSNSVNQCSPLESADQKIHHRRSFFSGPFKRHNGHREITHKSQQQQPPSTTPHHRHRSGLFRRSSLNELATALTIGYRKQMVSTAEAVGEDEESTGGTTDSDGASINSAEVRRDSIQSVDSASTIGDEDEEDVATGGSSGNEVDLKNYVGVLRKLFEKSTKLLEISNIKKLLAIYDDLSARLTTIVEVELPQLEVLAESRLTSRQQTINMPSIDAASSHASVSVKISAPGSTADSPAVQHQQPSSDGAIATGSSNGGLRKVLGLNKSASFGATSTTSGTIETEAKVPTTGQYNYVPTSLLVRPTLLWKVEKQRTDVGELCNPSDVAFLPDSSALVVAEYDSINERNNRLQLFGLATGRAVGTIGQGQIQPLGVTATRDAQHLAVTDCRGKRVRLVALANGQTVLEIGKGQFGWPYGIAIASHGQIVVTDAFNDCVSVYAPDGKKLKTFGGPPGSAFRNPYHVAVDDRDNVLVSDFGNNVVKAFDLTGTLLYVASESSHRMSSEQFTSLAGGSGKHQVSAAGTAGRRRRLKGPRGIAVEPRQRLVVVADDRSRVCLFSAGGQYVRNLLTDEDSVKYPEAIDCNHSGLMAVTEWNQNNAFAVKLFNLYG